MKKITVVFKQATLSTLLLTLSACGGMTAKQDAWQTLKPLEKYPETAFKLRDDVAYLEFRQYTQSSTRGRKRSFTPYSQKEFKTIYKIDKQPLTSFDKKTVSKLNALAPKFDSSADIRKHSAFGFSFSMSSLANAFYILKDNTVGIEHKISKVLPLLDKIDTPAEAQMVLWLHRKHEGTKYRKVQNGYEFIVEYDNSVSNHGPCGHFKYLVHIGSDGKILSNKLLEKKESKHGCVAYD